MHCKFSRGVNGFFETITDISVTSYNPIIDTTRQVITDRRMAFLLLLSQYISSSRDPKDFWQQLVRCLQIDHMDLPFALVYSAGWDVNETLSESSEQSHAMKNWVLEGLFRVDETSDSETSPKKNDTVPQPAKCETKLTEAALQGTPNKVDSSTPIPRRFTTEESMEEFIPNFSEMVRADAPTLLSVTDGTFPLSLAKHLNHPDRDAHYRAAVFLPIKSTGDSTMGFLILGVNPWKNYDEDYQGFVELLSRQLASSMAVSILSCEDFMKSSLGLLLPLCLLLGFQVLIDCVNRLRCCLRMRYGGGGWWLNRRIVIGIIFLLSWLFRRMLLPRRKIDFEVSFLLCTCL